MKKGLLIGVTVTLAAGITIYLLNKRKSNELAQRRIAISDAGYETAADLLYPMRSSRLKRSLS